MGRGGAARGAGRAGEGVRCGDGTRVARTRGGPAATIERRESLRCNMITWRNRSPGDLSIELPEVRATPVAPVVEGASAAFRGWARTPLAERGALLRRCQAAIEAEKQSLAEGIALETGKPLREAVGEVGAVVAKFELTIADAERFLAEQRPQNAHPAVVRHRPRGVAAVVGPFNFPIHLPHGQIVAYLLAGNPVVFKPSPLAAVVGARYAELMAAELPAGVFDLVQGGGGEGQALCAHPAVRSVGFTGSVPVGKALATSLAADLSKDVALELGGKNAAIVCGDADVEKAAAACAEAACLTAGQRCNATSRVIVDASVAAEFSAAFAKAIEAFAPGDPLDERTTLGPLVSAAAVDRYAKAIALRDGEWLVPGAVEPQVNGKRGHYVRPAVVRLDGAAAGRSPLFTDEVFAPVVAVVASAGVDDAVRLHDLTPYGLTASIFTRSRATFDRVAADLHVGNVYANLPTTFSPSTLPFGGLGDSGNRHPGGRGFVRFAADEQVVQEATGTLE